MTAVRKTCSSFLILDRKLGDELSVILFLLKSQANDYMRS